MTKQVWNDCIYRHMYRAVSQTNDGRMLQHAVPELRRTCLIQMRSAYFSIPSGAESYSAGVRRAHLTASRGQAVHQLIREIIAKRAERNVVMLSAPPTPLGSTT